MTLSLAQHEERLTGLGASDSAVALGLSKWKTPLELHLEKTQELEAPDISDRQLIKWGNRLETAIADGWAEDTGIRVARVNQTLRHPEHPFMLCHLDRRQVGLKRVLECKNVNQFYGNQSFGEAGTDQVPDNYLIQIHHQILITRALWAWQGGELAALIGGNDLKTYSFEYDAEVEDLIITRLAKFWQGVQDGTPPPPSTISDLEMLYAEDNGEIKEVDSGVLEIWKRYHDLKEHADRFTRELNSVKDNLRFAIAESAGIRLENIEGGPEVAGIKFDGRRLATWKFQLANRLDTKRLKEEKPEIYKTYLKQSGTRVLRISKP